MPIYMGIFEKPNVLDKKFKGDVKAKEYEGWVELQSAQVGRSRRIASASAGADASPAARAVDPTGRRQRPQSRTSWSPNTMTRPRPHFSGRPSSDPAS